MTDVLRLPAWQAITAYSDQHNTATEYAAAIAKPVQLDVSCRYWTLAEPYTLEVEIKKSQFIATAWPVASAAEVRRKFITRPAT